MASGKTGFPSLKPAVIFKLNVGASDVTPIGPVATGSTLMHIRVTSGTLTSVEGFEPKIDAQIAVADDFMYFYPDKEHVRINIKGIARTTEGIVIGFFYGGAVKLNDEVNAIFNLSPEAHTTAFGQATTQHTFEAADPKYKHLANESFIGNGRFVVEDGKVTVETRVSMAIPSRDPN